MGIFVEIVVYSNSKQTAQLFAKLKISEQQQLQMANLLDTMPDSVLICSKVSQSTKE